MDTPHLFVPFLSVLCLRSWHHGTKCSQKVTWRGQIESVSFSCGSTLYEKYRKVKREEASFSLNTAKSDGVKKEMMETVLQPEWTEGWLWSSVESTLVHVEISSPIVFVLPSGLDGVKTTFFLLEQEKRRAASHLLLAFTLLSLLPVASAAKLSWILLGNPKARLCLKKQKKKNYLHVFIGKLS